MHSPLSHMGTGRAPEQMARKRARVGGLFPGQGENVSFALCIHPDCWARPKFRKPGLVMGSAGWRCCVNSLLPPLNNYPRQWCQDRLSCRVWIQKSRMRLTRRTLTALWEQRGEYAPCSFTFLAEFNSSPLGSGIPASGDNLNFLAYCNTHSFFEASMWYPCTPLFYLNLQF